MSQLERRLDNVGQALRAPLCLKCGGHPLCKRVYRVQRGPARRPYRRYRIARAVGTYADQIYVQVERGRTGAEADVSHCRPDGVSRNAVQAGHEGTAGPEDD